MTRSRIMQIQVLGAAILFAVHVGYTQPLNPAVIAEEVVYSFEPPDNGSGPMWCRGNTCIVRIGDEVFASGLETVTEWKPLNNCLPLLFARTPGGWEQVFRGKGRTREPGPVARDREGNIFYSINPTLTEPDAYNGPAEPKVLQFDAEQINQKPDTLLPKWDGEPEFTEHSYRTFVADGKRGELLLMQNIGYGHAEWSFRDENGEWSASGQLKWPFEEEYDKPQPVRLCYPAVALQDRNVFFAGVSDIIEPYDEWRGFKHELTGQKWDYDFRRLFFTWSDDITTGEFHEWVEIASRDKTAGWITPWDMYVHDDGRVFVLWTERAIDERLRDKFFPNAKQRHSLEMAIVNDGMVIERTTIAERNEGQSGLVPSAARFHISEGNRLFVFYYASGTVDDEPVAGNFIQEMHFDGAVGKRKPVPFEVPFTNFFTATVRAGNEPSNRLDVFGQHDLTMRYGCVELF